MMVLLRKKDGGVSIMSLHGYALQAAEFDLDVVVRGEIASWPPEFSDNVESWRIVADQEIPLDRTFRAAWKDEGTLTVDMPKARDIQRDRLRRLRKPLLEALDLEYMRAMEQGLSTKEIVARKQVLRDVTAIKGFETDDVETLKTVGMDVVRK